MLACVLTKTYSTKFTILDLLSPHNWRKKILELELGLGMGSSGIKLTNKLCCTTKLAEM